MQHVSGRADPREHERAILRTLLYSDLFDYPLTADEIAHYLISVPGTARDVADRLARPVWLNGQVARVGEFVTLRGRESLVDLRRRRELDSRRLWRRAHFLIRIIACLPFIRMVAVTGSLSMSNSAWRDDIDLMIVTTRGRVWLGRAFSILVVHAARLFGIELCPNYVISEAVLSVGPRCVFVAHEFVQMVPLYGLDVHRRMREANPWIDEILPNAQGPLRRESECRPGAIARLVKGMCESLLAGRFGDRIERWEMVRKLPRLGDAAGNAPGAVVLDHDHVKGHFKDHGVRITEAFERRLAEYKLAD